MATVGVVRDPRFQKHLEGVGERHPENPRRLESIEWAIGEAGLNPRLRTVPPRPATDAELARIHHPELLERLARVKGVNATIDADTWLTPESYTVAREAVGATVDLVKAVNERRFDRGFALVRPPGHHATPDRAMGFCLLNNVALAAQSLLDAGLKRVAIVDIDVHHGNGTQDAFYERNDVLFVSTHQFPYYPGSGAAEEIGAGAGQGFTVNLPLPARCGDQEFARAHQEIVGPILREYAPEFVLVSAGYDAHRDDPIGGMRLTVDGYRNILAGLLQVAEATAGGRIALVLEGGYHHGALAQCVVAHLRMLLGEGGPPPEAPATTVAGLADSLDGALRRIRMAQKGHWKSLS